MNIVSLSLDKYINVPLDISRFQSYIPFQILMFHNKVWLIHWFGRARVSERENIYIHDLLCFLYFACVFSALFSFCLFSLFGVEFNKTL
jgi:hypothetical protein